MIDAYDFIKTTTMCSEWYLKQEGQALSLLSYSNI